MRITPAPAHSRSRSASPHLRFPFRDRPWATRAAGRRAGCCAPTCRKPTTQASLRGRQAASPAPPNPAGMTLDATPDRSPARDRFNLSVWTDGQPAQWVGNHAQHTPAALAPARRPACQSDGAAHGRAGPGKPNVLAQAAPETPGRDRQAAAGRSMIALRRARFMHFVRMDPLQTRSATCRPRVSVRGPLSKAAAARLPALG